MSTVQTNQQVSSSLLAAVNGTGSSSTSAATALTDATNQFMTLLTTQLKNQDPLNPTDNSQITSQLAQLSTVSGINQLNSTVDTLLTNLQTSQSYQAASLVGHNVLVAGNDIALSSSTSTSGTTTTAGYLGVNLPQGANNVTITINDASGNQVKQITLGTQTAGTLPLSWDGTTDSGTTAPDGNYTFSVKATVSGQSVTATALSYQPVVSVSNSSTGVTLNLGNNTSVSTSSVQEIF